jgi:hypothetical protein
MPVGRSVGTAERDECRRRAGGGVKYGERESAGRKAERICGVPQEFAAVTSCGSGAGNDGACAGDGGGVEREVNGRFFVLKRPRIFLPVVES